MKFVVDTNVIIASLIKDSVTRKFLIETPHTLYAPEFAITEIENHLEELIKKTKKDKRDILLMLKLVVSNIEIVSKTETYKAMDEAIQIIGNEDKNDAPIIACAIRVNADGIVTYDKDFRKQKRFRILIPEELIKIQEK